MAPHSNKAIVRRWLRHSRVTSGPDSSDWPASDALAGYVMAADKSLSGQTADAILAGRLYFPEPEGAEGRAST
jgi:hypothetical protein